MLAYGTSADQLDDLTRMAESIPLRNLKFSCNSIIRRYGTEFMRAPTKDNMKMVLLFLEAKSQPGCLGSLNVMQREWKNCSKAYRGAFQGKDEVDIVALEAGAVDCRISFWHIWFGTPGANNNLNILDCSPIWNSTCHLRNDGAEYCDVSDLSFLIVPSMLLMSAPCCHLG